MTLQEFIKNNVNKKVDFDGAYGAQCVDLYRFYVRDVWKLPQTPGVKGAFQIFDTLNTSIYEKVRYSAGLFPKPGDVVIWNEGLVKNGHVGIVESATSSAMNVFDQNNPEGAASKMHMFSYRHVTGWFRPKKINEKNMKLPLIKFSANTVYLVAGWSLFPFASLEAFLHAGGNFDDVVQVPDSEKGKYNIRYESHIVKQPSK